MARWSTATLVALGGFDKNIIIDELLYGEDNFYDITFLSDTQRTVNSIATNIITFIGGDNTVFTIGDYVSFGSSSELFEIAAITTNTITLATTPFPGIIVNGQSIQIPINLSSLSSGDFTFRLLQHSATISDDPGNRNGATISNIQTLAGATELDLDSNVITNVPGQSLTLGQLRVLVNAADLPFLPDPPDGPVIDTTTPGLYTGYIGVQLPSPDGGFTPSQQKKQRICFVVRANGVNT